MFEAFGKNIIRKFSFYIDSLTHFFVCLFVAEHT